jgi:hypothetical protein
MADPAYYRTDAQGNQIPVYRQATPGFGGALLDAIRAITGAVAPQSITQRKQKIDQAVDQPSQSPQTTDLGNQF